MSNELTLYDVYKNSPVSLPLYVYCDGKSNLSISADDLYKYICIISSEIETFSVQASIICCLLKSSTDILPIYLGILKLSCAFAVLDPEKPIKALLTFQKFVNIKTLIIEESFLLELSELCSCWKKVAEFSVGHNYSVLQASFCCVASCPNTRSNKQLKEYHNIAYVIQTSGSTGEPKVVQVPHKCIIPNILDFRSRFSVCTTDIILQSTPLTFDPSVIEIFLALACGASLILIPEHIKQRSYKLSEIIIQNKVTILQVTPSLISSFNEDTLKNNILGDDSSVRLLLLGGEQCPSIQKLKKWCSAGNKTEIYNLYGITEVSCWASCFKINLKNRSHMSDVPLGEPLLDTVLEAKSCLEDKTVKELYIGSAKRFCIVNDEELENSNWFVRATGDLVKQDSSGSLYFQSRSDSVIKYKGRKVSLKFLNDMIENKYPEISQHYLHFHKFDEKLYLFAMINRKDFTSQSVWRNKIIQTLRENKTHLPAIEVVNISFVPLNKHRKVDIGKLMQLAEQQKKRKFYSKSDVLHKISSLWKTHTKQSTLSENDNFVLKGGDSISAVQFAADTELELQVCIPSLIEDVLNKSFKDVVSTVLSYLRNGKEQKASLYQNESAFSSDTVSEVSFCKRICKVCFQVCCKRGYLSYCLHDQQCFPPKLDSDTKLDISLNLLFKWDLKKCVDATPCIAYFHQRELIFAFIGSHSGVFSCLNIKQKIEMWKIYLPDRIESSACLSSCGDYILFGCYDHHLYCVAVTDGSILWKFKTGAEVKCSPVVSNQNIAFVGSHDKFIYSINIENGNILWKNRISDGSIFASPAVCEEMQSIIVATLDGEVAMLKMDTGEMVWNYQSGKPLFSSPIVISNSVFVGSTDNCIFQFQLDGQMMNKHVVSGPVFSSAVVKDISDECISFGCHDTYVYCISIYGGILWSVKCDSVVYASPFPFTWKSQKCVAVASSAGTLYILNQEDGKEKLSHKFSGELFSSPVVMHEIVAIGCRDDHIYFFELK